MSKKTTKRALAMSFVSVFLCVCMLVGTTFAWFTDSVTSSNNVIKSGTLDVTMEWKDATANGAQQTYKDASTGAIFDYAKWEPGYVAAKNVKISNVGTLALKYQLNIVANGEVSELADVIDVYFAEGEYVLASREMTELTKIGTLTEVLAGMPANMSGDLDASTADTVTIALKMQESANNDYQNLAIGSDFSVQLFATQLTAEEDSFDDQYDAGANYEGEVDSAEELAVAMLKGGNIVVLGTITDTTLEAYSETRNVVALYRPTQNSTLSGGKIVLDNSTANWGFVVDAKNNVNVTVKDTEIVGNNNWNMHNIVAPGSKLTIENVKVSATGGSGIYVTGGGEAVINNATVAQDGLNAGAQPWAPTAVATSTGSTVTINGGTYEGTTYGVYIYNSGAKVTINDGTFKAPQVLKADGSYTDQTVRGEFVVNGGNFDGQINMTNGYAYCTINGGNFTNFSVLSYSPVVIKGGTFDADPSAYVATGYEVVDNGDGTYTVKVDLDNVCSAASFADALEEGGNITVTANIETTEMAIIPEGTAVTMNLNGKTISSANGTNIVIRNYGELTLENGTVEGNMSNYAIRNEAGSELVVEDGTVVDGGFGAISCFGGTITVEGGSFTNKEKNATHYVVYATNNSTVVINGGTFTFADDQYAGSAGSPILASTNGSSIVINGGTFDAGTGSALCYNANNIVINGGTFKNRATATYGGTIENKVADGKTVTKDGTTWTVS